MMVGEAPAARKTCRASPSGRAGQLLDRMLKAIGLDRSKVFIVNTVPWRPPGNREPTPEEMALCRPFLERQIELVAPKVMVTLGNVPTKALFGTTTGIMRMHGQWKELTVGAHKVPAIAMFHPAYLLRQPAQKGLARATCWRSRPDRGDRPVLTGSRGERDPGGPARRRSALFDATASQGPDRTAHGPAAARVRQDELSSAREFGLS